jgi:hypothetical protein
MRWAPTVWVLFLVGGSLTASAQPLELRWQAPDECPDRAQLQAKVDRLLGRSYATFDWLADARVARKGERWTLKLDLQHGGRHAARTLQADDCVTLSDAAAWLIAVAIDPSVSSPAPTAAASSAATSEAAGAAGVSEVPVADNGKPAQPPVAGSEVRASDPIASSENAAKQPPLQSDDAGTTPVLGAGAFMGISAAGLGGPAASLGAQAQLRLGWLWFGLLVGHDFERSRNLPLGLASHFSSQEYGLQFCLQWGGAVRFGPCLALSVRSATASTSANQGKDGSAVWATLDPRAQLTYDLFTQLELFVNAGLLLPFTARPQFEVVQFGLPVNVGHVAKYGGSVRLGVGMHWP